MRTLSHDAFARTSLVKRTAIFYTMGDKSCYWCGNLSKSGKLFQYGTEDDARPGRVNWHLGHFCSKGCHDTFHS